MKSKASLRGHPIHPMLVHFPIGFLVGGLVADVAGKLLDYPELFTVAWYLIPAGVVTGLIAGVPGFIDYRVTVPPKSSARKRAFLHMCMNVAALLIFLLAWWLRGQVGLSPEWALVGMELIGAGFIGAGGWMGGTLVHRNQIGVDHRHPAATQWSEASFKEPGAVRVAELDELGLDQMKLLHIASVVWSSRRPSTDTWRSMIDAPIGAPRSPTASWLVGPLPVHGTAPVSTRGPARRSSARPPRPSKRTKSKNVRMAST